MRKEDEVKRTVKAFHEAVEFADKLDRGIGARDNGDCNQSERSGNNIHSRAPRPPIAARPSITHYSRGELVELIRWINSDGQLRTDDQLVTEMVATLGFSRRGPRIEEGVRQAIGVWRSVETRR